MAVVLFVSTHPPSPVSLQTQAVSAKTENRKTKRERYGRRCDSGGNRAKEDDIKQRGPLPEPGFDSEESIPPAYLAWRASTTNRVVVSLRLQAGNRFLGSLKCLQIRAPLRLRERNAVSLYRSLRTKYGDLLIERDSLRYRNTYILTPDFMRCEQF